MGAWAVVKTEPDTTPQADPWAVVKTEPINPSLPGSTARLRKAAGAPEEPTPGEEWVGAYKKVGGQILTGAKNAVTGVAGLLPRTLPDVALSLANPPAYLNKKMVVEPAVETGRKAMEAPTVSEKIGYGAATALPVLGPLAAHWGEKIGEGKLGEVLGEGAVMAATGALGPKALARSAKIANGWLESRAAGKYAPAAEARISTTQVLGKDATFHDTLDAAVPQIVADAGGLDNITGAAPKGTVRRFAEAAEISAAKQHEYTRSVFVNQAGNETVSVAPIVSNLKQLATRAFRVAEPETSGIIAKAIENGELTVAEAYELKSRLNAIADPAYTTKIGEKGAPSPKIAKDAAQHLQQEVARKLNEVQKRLGAEYLKSDRLQGKIGAVRNAAIDAANAADNLLPKKSANISLADAAHAATSPKWAVIRMGARKFFDGPAHPDVVLNKALQKLELRGSLRPEIPAELGANLRSAAPGATVQGPAFQPWDELSQMETGGPLPEPPWATGSAPASPMVNRRVSPVLRPPVQPGNISVVNQPTRPSGQTPLPGQISRARRLEAAKEGIPFGADAASLAERAGPPVGGRYGIEPTEGIANFDLRQPGPKEPFATPAEIAAFNQRQVRVARDRFLAERGARPMQVGPMTYPRAIQEYRAALASGNKALQEAVLESARTAGLNGIGIIRAAKGRKGP